MSMLIFDRIELPTERRFTDEGYLEVPALIARPGIQEYRAGELGLTDRDPNIIVRVHRPPDEVFDDNSLKSFANKPVTNTHPPVLVDKSNAKKFTVGHASPDVLKETTADGDFAKTTLFVFDGNAINEIEAGKVELSNGYTADITFTPGISADGLTYDAIQSNIRGNHIAIVDKARGGSSLRVFDDRHTHQIKDSPMPKNIMIDGVDYEVSEQAAQAIAKALNDANQSLSAQATQHKTEKATLTADRDSVQAKLDDALAKVHTPEQLDVMITARTALVDDAKAVVSDVDWKGKSDHEIRLAVVTKKVGTITNDSEAYVQARFDILVENVKSDPTRSVTTALGVQASAPVTDADDKTDSDKARDEFTKRQRDVWKGKRSA